MDKFDILLQKLKELKIQTNSLTPFELIKFMEEVQNEYNNKPFIKG